MQSPGVQSSQEMVKEHPPGHHFLHAARTKPILAALLFSRQEAEEHPYFSQERVVPIWAFPAVLETAQAVEKVMDACSHEGVNSWLPNTITPPVTSDLIEDPGEGQRIDPRVRGLQHLQEGEKTQAYLWVCCYKAKAPTQDRGLRYCSSSSEKTFVCWLLKALGQLW